MIAFWKIQILRAPEKSDRSRDAGAGAVFAGASCIYSLLGAREYSWRFIASDIDELALQHAGELVAENDLKQQIVLSHLA